MNFRVQPARQLRIAPGKGNERGAVGGARGVREVLRAGFARCAPCRSLRGARPQATPGTPTPSLQLPTSNIPCPILAPRDRPEYQPFPTSNSHLTNFSTSDFPTSNFQTFQTFPTSQLPTYPALQPSNLHPVNLQHPTPPLLTPTLIFISIKYQHGGEVWRGGGTGTLQKA